MISKDATKNLSSRSLAQFSSKNWVRTTVDWLLKNQFHLCDKTSKRQWPSDPGQLSLAIPL